MLTDQVIGQATGNRKSLPRKSCLAHESTHINGKYSCQTLCSSMSNGLHINHLMSSYVLLQKSFHICSAPNIFQSLTPVTSLFSCPLLGLHILLTSPLHGHHPVCVPPKEVRRQGTFLLHETQSPHNPHQQQSSSASACERAAGVRQGAFHDRALNVLAVLFLTFLSACQNVTPCNTHMWEEHGRETEKIAATS